MLRVVFLARLPRLAGVAVVGVRDWHQPHDSGHATDAADADTHTANTDAADTDAFPADFGTGNGWKAFVVVVVADSHHRRRRRRCCCGDLVIVGAVGT